MNLKSFSSKDFWSIIDLIQYFAFMWMHYEYKIRNQGIFNWYFTQSSFLFSEIQQSVKNGTKGKLWFYYSYLWNIISYLIENFYARNYRRLLGYWLIMVLFDFKKYPSFNILTWELTGWVRLFTLQVYGWFQ